MTLGLVCHFPRCTIRSVHITLQLKGILQCSDIGHGHSWTCQSAWRWWNWGGSWEFSGHQSSYVSAITSSWVFGSHFWGGSEVQETRSHLTHQPLPQHFRVEAHPPETTCSPFMLKLCLFCYHKSCPKFLLVLDRPVSLDGLDLTAEPGACNQEGIAFLWISLIWGQNKLTRQSLSSLVEHGLYVLLRSCRCWKNRIYPAYVSSLVHESWWRAIRSLT